MRGITFLILLCWNVAISADENSARLEMRIASADTHYVGETVRLEVDLLTTLWFSRAPVTPTLTLPNALVKSPNGQGLNLTIEAKGVSWFGIRFTYLITPTSAGDFTIPSLSFQVTEGQNSTPITINSDPISFTVINSGSASSTAIGLVAKNLKVHHQIEHPKRDLKVGDSIVRTVRIEAEDASAILIPPLVFTDIPGLKRYEEAPEVAALKTPRGQDIGGVRVDRVSYVIEEAGRYVLPELEIHWYNSQTKATEINLIPAVHLRANRSGNEVLPFGLDEDLAKLRRMELFTLTETTLAWFFGACSMMLCTLVMRHQWLIFYKQQNVWWKNIFQRWLASEHWAWHRLKQATRSNQLPLAEIYRWQKRMQDRTNLDLLLAVFPAHYATKVRMYLAQIFCAHQATTEPLNLLPALQESRKTLKKSKAQQQKQPLLKSLRHWETPDN